jgi:SAM-dependent MidA family methyltransferase
MVPFSVYMDDALYGPTGFYTTGGGAGRRRDFLTSPEVGPLFGAVLARAIDEWWDALGRPDPFVLIEAGAGPGTLARTILHAKPAVLPALRYLLVDRSPAMRARQAEILPIVDASLLFGSIRPVDDPDEPRATTPGAGPIVSALSDLPAPGLIEHGIVLANELLDNLAFDVAERTDEGWFEVFVLDGAEYLRPIRAAPDLDAPVGARVPLQHGAQEWLRRVLRVIAHGRVVAIDYAVDRTADLLDRPWMRTYREQAVGSDVFDRPGTQDITTDVAIDQLVAVAAPASVITQADFLRRYGIDDLVAEGRRWWDAGAARPDLHAIEGRSRGVEAEALLDPKGLGAFRVIEWTV